MKRGPGEVRPVNIAEAIVDPFFDQVDSILNEYESSGMKQYEGEVLQGWANAQWGWRRAAAGAELGTVKRECRIDVSGYDLFVVRASVSAGLAFDVKLTVDGTTQTVIEHASGSDDYHEYSGQFAGNELTRIELLFHALADGRLSADLEWTALASSERLSLLHFSRRKLDPNWPEGIKPDSVRGPIVPTLGIFFGEEDLPKLRARIGSSIYSTLYASLKEQAEQFLSSKPEEDLTEAVSTVSLLTRDRYAPKSMGTYIIGARLCAFVGLMEDDDRFLRMAARIALSMSQTPQWDEWLESVPGTAWDDRGFVNYMVSVACVNVLDWAGGILTESGKEAIRRAVAKKGIPCVQYSLMKYDYMWECNQGIWAAYGWIVSLLALEKAWPHVDMLIDTARDAIVEMMIRYVAPDGGAAEGIGYLAPSLAQGIAGLWAYARYRGVALRSVIPDRLFRTADFLLAMASEGTHPGTEIPIADGGRVANPASCAGVSALYLALQDSRLFPLLRVGYSRNTEEQNYSLGHILDILAGPDPEALEAGAENDFRTPRFMIFPDTGIATSSRQAKEGRVRVLLTGGGVGVSHGHEDRGGLIVEAFGETLLNEAGMISYSVPEHHAMRDALYHNLATPGSIDEYPRQLNPCPVPTIPEGSGDEVELHLRIDTTPAWGGSVRRCVRRIESTDPLELIVIDEVELERPQEITVRFNSVAEAQTDEGEGRHTLTMKRARAIIIPEWDVCRSRCVRIGTNTVGEPVYQLALESRSSPLHRLRTRILLQKRNPNEEHMR